MIVFCVFIFSNCGATQLHLITSRCWIWVIICYNSSKTTTLKWGQNDALPFWFSMQIRFEQRPRPTAEKRRRETSCSQVVYFSSPPEGEANWEICLRASCRELTCPGLFNRENFYCSGKLGWIWVEQFRRIVLKTGGPQKLAQNISFLQSWKWNMGAFFDSSYLSNAAIFHFHNFERKSNNQTSRRCCCFQKKIRRWASKLNFPDFSGIQNWTPQDWTYPKLKKNQQQSFNKTLAKKWRSQTATVPYFLKIQKLIPYDFSRSEIGSSWLSGSGRRVENLAIMNFLLPQLEKCIYNIYIYIYLYTWMANIQQRCFHNHKILAAELCHADEGDTTISIALMGLARHDWYGDYNTCIICVYI